MFVTRLNELFDFLNITHIELAEKMGIQRTTFNHLLSGRNKPGFEFWVKLHTCYPTINLNWLINGFGEITIDTSKEMRENENNNLKSIDSNSFINNIFSNHDKSLHMKVAPLKQPKELIEEIKLPIEPTFKEENIARIIIVYSNGKMIELK